MDDKAPKKAPKRKRKKRTYPSEKRCVCKECGQKYYFESKLAQHMLVHTGEKPYKCPVKKCGKEFNTSYSLKNHSYIHTREKPYKCPVKKCGKEFNTSYSLKNHSYIHTNEKPFKCSFCDYACRDNSTLRKHQLRHMGIKNKYECKICSKTYNIKARLKLHVAEVHLEVDVRKFACDQCDKKFKTNCSLRLHVKNVHNLGNACKCPICGAYVSNKSNLPQHLLRHSEHRPYLCVFPGCDKRYKDAMSLKKHARIHYPDQQHRCVTCGKMFTRIRRLEHHWKTVHNKKKCVECDYCGQRFYSKNYLINHIQRKHGRKKKRYKCDHCDFITTNKPSIVMHIKYGHGTENDRECHICHTIYKRHVYLKLHYAKTHGIRYKTRPRAPPIEIKQEPEDDEVSIDLFEIEKEEPEGDSNMDTDATHSVNENEQATGEGNVQIVSENMFEDFFIQHVIMPFDDEVDMNVQKPYYQIDTEAKEKAKKTIQMQINEAKRKEAVENVERTRQLYNERMRKLMSNIGSKEKPIKIKFFKKAKKYSTKVNCDNNNDSENKSNDEITSTNVVPRSSQSNDEQKSEDEKYEIKTTLDDEQNSSNTDDDQKPLNTNIHPNSALEDNKASKSSEEEKTNDDEKSSNVNNEQTSTLEDQKSSKSNEGEKTIKSDDEKSSDEESNDDSDDEDYKDEEELKQTVSKNRKVNFNTHQCYVCFKLFSTLEQLLEHCKDHFDICSEKSLKKCPLCDYVSKHNTTKHLRAIHGVSIKIPYGRIKDKKDNSDGCRYFFEIDDPVIEKMEVIPSLKNLNKLESMKIDKKKREDNDKSVSKTKLVRKGKEWIVEKEKISINSDMIPKLDSDVIRSIKLGDTDSYFDGLKKMYHAAKKSGKKILFPCQHCDKICQNLSALKLHSRRHDPNKKPFKPKVWKHKLKPGADNQPKVNKVKTDTETENRTAKPKPIRHKHKCDPKLKEFYENNIRGGDIEFWQFLKIYNKMDRENIKDFDDLKGRYEFGIGHQEKDEPIDSNEIDNAGANNNSSSTKSLLNISTSGIKTKNKVKTNIIRTNKGKGFKSKIAKIYKKVVRLSKEEQHRRNLIKNKLREKAAQNIQSN